jgi:hypothetical protein
MRVWNSDCWHSQNWKQCQGAATSYITNCTENTSRDTQPTAIDTEEAYTVGNIMFILCFNKTFTNYSILIYIQQDTTLHSFHIK